MTFTSVRYEQIYNNIIWPAFTSRDCEKDNYCFPYCLVPASSLGTPERTEWKQLFDSTGSLREEQEVNRRYTVLHGNEKQWHKREEPRVGCWCIFTDGRRQERVTLCERSEPLIRGNIRYIFRTGPLLQGIVHPFKLKLIDNQLISMACGSKKSQYCSRDVIQLSISADIQMRCIVWVFSIKVCSRSNSQCSHMTAARKLVEVMRTFHSFLGELFL